MTTTTGKFTTVGLGTASAKYFWNGQELHGIIKMFIYKGTSVTLTVINKEIIPYQELRDYGIKIKVAV